MTKKSVWCFGLVILAVFSLGVWFIGSDAFAACNSAGYCYGTGRDPLGGLCGNPNNTGAYWDTCFGLSWQYYEWPEDSNGNPIDYDIKFPGSTNAGYATVSKECGNPEYGGGFWFLGYEVYQPSTGNSLGYQVGSPRVRMLSDYGTSGYAPLYVGTTPSPVTVTVLGSPATSIKIKGEKYADVNVMEKDIMRLFEKYAEGGRLISSSGNADFSDINWFCAGESIPPPPPDQEVSGAVSVVYKGDSETAGWNNESIAIKYVTIREGESAPIVFNDYMRSNGIEAGLVNYTIKGDFVPNGSESGIFVLTEGDTSEQTVGTHSGNVTTSGVYCESLEFTFKGAPHKMQACADVTVIPTPPTIYGNVGVEATIYSEDGSVKSTVPLTETGWSNDQAVTPVIAVDLEETDYADIRFVDSMKGEGSNPYDMIYRIENPARAGVVINGTYHYAGDDGAPTQVGEYTFEGVNQNTTICETLSYGTDDEPHQKVACATVVRQINPPEERLLNGDDAFDFSVDVNLKLTVSLSNRLVKSSGLNGDFLRDYTTLGVSSNNIAGYRATFTTDKNSTNENATNLIHDYKDSIVPTLTSTVYRGEFPTGRWGYSLDDTLEGDDESTYGPVVAMDSNSPIEVISADGPGSTNQDIYFAAKMDAIQPTGTYSNSVVFKVVTNVLVDSPTTIDDIEYMQDINDEVIASMVRGQQYQLKDKRDEKTYWVAKLPNDYVMMTQNLDLELRYGDVLDSDTSDIGYGDARGGYKSGRNYWIVDHTTQITMTDPKTSNWNRTSADGNVTQYFVSGYGSYLLNITGGRSYRAASNPLVGTFGEASYDYYIGPESVPGHYIDDADCAASTEFTEEDCAHGHVGVLYNEASALAGPEPRLGYYRTWDTTIKAYTDSICPKGWRLPGLQDYYRLNAGGSGNTRVAPYYFNHIPYYYGNGLAISSYASYYNMAREYNYQYYLYIADDYISNSSNSSSGTDNYGYAIRCLARYGIKE